MDGRAALHVACNTRPRHRQSYRQVARRGVLIRLGLSEDRRSYTIPRDMILEEAAVVEPVHPFQPSELDGIDAALGTTRWITSVLNGPMAVSASGFVLSPTLPTDGSMPASATRSV